MITSTNPISVKFKLATMIHRALLLPDPGLFMLNQNTS